MKKFLILFFVLIAGYTNAQQEYRTEENVSYYPETEKKDAYTQAQCVLDVYYPKGAKNFATIVWFHGGGLTSGRKEIPAALKGKGYAIIGVGYRFSPKVTAPAYIEDAAAAVAWVFKNIGRYGGDSRQIFVSGHSAGAYLGMMVTLDKKYLSKYGLNSDQIAGLIPFSGQVITHFTIRKERNIEGTRATIDEYAPLYHVRKSCPPVLLITGDRNLELLGRYEENAYLWRMFKLVGNEDVRLFELDGFDHGQMAEPAFPLLIREVKDRAGRISSNKAKAN